jgi:hypothetical protein
VSIKGKIASWLVARGIANEAEERLESALGRPLKRKERAMLKNMLLGNWVTTLLGIIAGAINLYVGGMTPKNALLSAALAALGVVGKDAMTGSSGLSQ